MCLLPFRSIFWPLHLHLSSSFIILCWVSSSLTPSNPIQPHPTPSSPIQPHPTPTFQGKTVGILQVSTMNVMPATLFRHISQVCIHIGQMTGQTSPGRCGDLLLPGLAPSRNLVISESDLYLRQNIQQEERMYDDLVGGWATPLKNMEFVSWDYEIPNIWKNEKWSKAPTSDVLTCVY